MQKPMLMFKSQIQGIESYFYFDNTSSTDIAKLALLEALKWIGQLEDQAKALEQTKADAQKSTEPQEPLPKAD